MHATEDIWIGRKVFVLSLEWFIFHKTYSTSMADYACVKWIYKIWEVLVICTTLVAYIIQTSCLVYY